MITLGREKVYRLISLAWKSQGTVPTKTSTPLLARGFRLQNVARRYLSEANGQQACLPISIPHLSANDLNIHEAVARISGNATAETKAACYRHLLFVTGVSPPTEIFAHSIGKGLRLLEVDFGPHAEEPNKMLARVVCEIQVGPDMLNALRTMHGGCIAHLLDICTCLPPMVMHYELHVAKIFYVSQNINTSYHAPASEDSLLRFVAISISAGSRIVSSQCEIWDKTYHRLVATGTQTLMRPSTG